MIDHLPTDLFQVLIVSKDAAKSAGALAEVFGVETPAPVILDPPEVAHAEYRGRATATRATVIPFLKLGPLDIEVIEPDREPSIWREFLERSGEGVSHLGIWVENLDEAIGFLSGKGVEVAHQASFVGGSYAIMDTKERLGVNLMLKHLDSAPNG